MSTFQDLLVGMYIISVYSSGPSAIVRYLEQLIDDLRACGEEAFNFHWGKRQGELPEYVIPNCPIKKLNYVLELLN